MSYHERRKKIIAAIETAENLTVFELSEKVGASPATIRRDLHEIAEQGLLVRTHGGAMKPERQLLTGFQEKSGVYEENKTRIGKAAAAMVQEGDIIFMDCGSTVFKMCPYLKKVQNLRIVTNSLPILTAMIEAPGVKINLIGGEIDKKRLSAHGLKATQHIASYRADKAFIGVDGLSAVTGLTAHSELEASITTAFISNAATNILLCDSSKIGRDSYLKFAELQDIQTLITDSGLDETQYQALQSGSLSIILS